MPERDDGTEPPVIRLPRADGGLPTTAQSGGSGADPTTPATAVDWQRLQAYCGTGLSPLIVNGLLLRIVQEHFRLITNRILDTPTTYVWDNSTSGLRVAVGTKFDLRNAGQLPAVLVYRGVQQAERQVIGDFAGHQILDTGEGAEDYVRWMNGQTVFQCLAQTDGAAEDLAQELFAFLSGYAPLFRQKLAFNDFEAREMGEPVVIDDTGSVIRIPVTCRYRYEYGWRITSSGPNFNGINTDGP